MTLEPGAEVLSADGQAVGVVHHVLAAEHEDIFDGLVIDIRRGPGGLRFADAPLVGRIYAASVELTIPAEEVERLPEPRPNPAAMEHHGPDDFQSPLAHKLHRAWEIISGRG